MLAPARKAVKKILKKKNTDGVDQWNCGFLAGREAAWRRPLPVWRMVALGFGPARFWKLEARRWSFRA